MCAVFGLIDYSKRFNAGQRECILSVLAKECEARGTDAAGYAYNNKNYLAIYKRPVPAHKLRLRLPPEANVIHGHTRMATQGVKEHNYNNHPFSGKAGKMSFALAHNGIIYNDYILGIEYSLPETRIETDSYIAVQLLEQEKSIDLKAIASMAEKINGSFVFTVLDRENNSYFVKGDNPLALYHFKDLGFYIYASTDEILLKALHKTGLSKFEFEEIETTMGDILQIDRNGIVTKSRFDLDNFYDYGYDCYFPYSYDEPDDKYAVLQLKEFAGYIGVDGTDVDLLLEYGFTVDEVEEMLYEPEYREMIMSDILCAVNEK